MDCNVFYLRTKDESWSMLIDSANDKGLRGKEWEGSKTVDSASITYEKLNDPNIYFAITHFTKRRVHKA